MHAFPLEVGRNKRKLLVLNITMETDFSLILVSSAFSDKKVARIHPLVSTCPSVRQFVRMETVEKS
jgi:hypothetical protein